ncbi:MAG: hypothetical protein IMF08_03600 [Proteobacteria bacterium]|nr:hypothetical protein [Pseudomonadota bacterium]
MGGCPNPALTSNPLTTPEDGPVVVSVCYSPGVTDLETETMPLAVEACADIGEPVDRPIQWKRAFFLNDCPLFKAMRVAYICQSDPNPPPPAQSQEAAPPPPSMEEATH